MRNTRGAARRRRRLQGTLGAHELGGIAQDSPPHARAWHAHRQGVRVVDGVGAHRVHEPRCRHLRRYRERSGQLQGQGDLGANVGRAWPGILVDDHHAVMCALAGLGLLVIHALLADGAVVARRLLRAPRRPRRRGQLRPQPRGHRGAGPDPQPPPRRRRLALRPLRSLRPLGRAVGRPARATGHRQLAREARGLGQLGAHH
mmetsp:Transcript_107205/g.300146  ORF Transcript_107205/g.300146 Transcript_107205/m.300146 type:complete len:202 (-) Transcript_107205:865-1470(-)